MSHVAVTWSWTVRGLDPSTRLVLLCLADHADRNTFDCVPGLRKVAEETETSVSTVRRGIAKLVEAGVLIVSVRQRNGSAAQTSNRYILAVEISSRQPDGSKVYTGYRPPSQNEGGATSPPSHSYEQGPPSNGDTPKNRPERTILNTDSAREESELDLGLPAIPPKDPTPEDVAKFIEEEWRARGTLAPLRGGRLTEAMKEKACKLAQSVMVEGDTLLTVWRDIFAKIDGSDWLQGKVPGKDGRPPYRLNVTSLLQRHIFTKAIGGSYDGTSTGERRRGSTSEATSRVLDRIRPGPEQRAGGGNQTRALART